MPRKVKNSCVLVISDMHIPYHHPDTFSFLQAIKDSFPLDRVICIGDELDYHAISFHSSDQDLFSAGHELEESIKYLQFLYEDFPRMDILHSNHGSLVYRKLKHHGVPLSVLKGYNDILGAPKGWVWHNELTIRLSDGRDCMFHHGLGSNVSQVSKNFSCNYVQGHYHSKFIVDYWGNHKDIYWSMNVGCLIDDKSLAFAYNKNTFKRPIIGCGIILDGQPKLLPMILNKKGRWIKKIV